MNNFFIVLALSVVYFTIVSCSGDAGVGELPSINVEPANISFDDANLFPNEKSEVKVLEIKNTGEGDLKLSKIAFSKISEGDLDYHIDTISNVKYADVTFPIVLKKGEIAKVKLYLIPTDEGVKIGSIEIDTNISGDDARILVNLSASDFAPELQINEAVSTGGSYNNQRKNIRDLTIKKCVPALDSRTLINICNIGKAALKIESIELEGGALDLEYIELEQVNTPAKLPGSFIPEEGNCITGLAICHNGNSGVEVKLRIKNTSDNNPNASLRLTTE